MLETRRITIRKLIEEYVPIGFPVKFQDQNVGRIIMVSDEFFVVEVPEWIDFPDVLLSIIERSYQ